MEYVYSVLLLYRAKKEINETNVKKVLEAAGIKVDEGRVKALVAALDGVNIDEAIKEAAVVPMAAPVAASGHAAHAPEAKKEEKKAPEDAAAGLGSLFG